MLCRYTVPFFFFFFFFRLSPQTWARWLPARYIRGMPTQNMRIMIPDAAYWLYSRDWDPIFPFLSPVCTPYSVQVSFSHAHCLNQTGQGTSRDDLPLLATIQIHLSLARYAIYSIQHGSSEPYRVYWRAHALSGDVGLFNSVEHGP
jgi:hypothetical protein